MTDILPWILANLLLFGIALAFLLFLVIGTAWAVSWYFWRWVIQAHDEPEPWREYIAHGDVPHLPDDYWGKVARKEAKRRAA